MNWLHLLLTIVVMSVLVWLARRAGRSNCLPYPTLLLIAGFAGSVALDSVGIDTGLRWYYFRDLVYFVLLPLLVYEAAFRLNANCLLHNMFAVFLLAMPLMLFGVLVIAAVLFWGIGQPQAFPLVAALIAAALISTNDPAAVKQVFQGVPVPGNLSSLLEGESLLNSILALVLVSLALQVEDRDASVAERISFLQGFILFVRLFTGGVLTGLAAGLVGWVVLRFARLPVLRVALSLVIAYGTFFLAYWILHVSAVVAVLTAGLLLNAYAQRTDQASSNSLEVSWREASAMTTTLLFLLLGMSVHVPVLVFQWKAALLGILAMVLARAVMVYGGLGLYGKVANAHAVPSREQWPVFLGGIKGAVTVALLLAVPYSLEYGQMITAAVYGAVLFSLLVQAPAVRLLMLYRARNAIP